MFSVVQLEEQLACMKREYDEKFDELGNNVWSLLSASDTASSFTIGLSSMGNNAKLKALDAYLESGRVAQDAVGCSPYNFGQFDSLSQGMIQNTQEMMDLLNKMNFKEISDEMEQLRAKKEEYRAKIANQEEEIVNIKHKKNAESVVALNILENLKEMREEIRSSFSQDLEKYLADRISREQSNGDDDDLFNLV